MKRLATLLVGCAIALSACSKKEDDKEPAKVDPKDPGKIEHGEKQGKGDGGGDKTAAGSKDGTRGSAKPAAADPKLIERGAYISNLGGCPLCHTAIDMSTMRPKMDMAFAGGLEMKEEIGSWRSPNITPDPETGIGSWTDEQILAAVRDGVRPDGSKVAIFMPWPFYSTMTDEDGKALVAFLRSLPPVKNKVERIPAPPIELPPMPPPKREDPADPVGHGAYLASIMHCVMCHTPFTEKGPDFSKAFAGGFQMSMPPGMGEGEIWSSNITPDKETGIGKWSEEDIAKSLKTMVRPNGKPIVGPMMFYAATWSKLTDEDAMAIAKFLKSLPPVKNKVKPTTYKLKGPPPGPPADKGTPADKPADHPADRGEGKQPT